MNRYKPVSLLFLIPFILMACQAPQAKTVGTAEATGIHESIPPSAFRSRLETKPGAILMDLRTPPEIAQGKIEGAIDLDFKTADFQDGLANMDKNTPVFIYCRSGGRSGKALKMMKNAGFKEVYDLKGGILAWQRDGGEVVR
jgi:rhodanese-related sulfurtransferase